MTPFTAVDNTGIPLARASKHTRGKPSYEEDKISEEISDIYVHGVSFQPKKEILSLILRVIVNFFNESASSPSPMMINFQGSLVCAIAFIIISTFFSFDSRPINARVLHSGL